MSSEENDSQMEVDKVGDNGTLVEDMKVEETPAAASVPKPVQKAGSLPVANPHYRVKISGLPRFYTPLVSEMYQALSAYNNSIRTHH